MASQHTLRADVAATSRQGATLRHPGPQFEARPPPPPPPASRPHPPGEAQLERVVGVLLRELSETRREKALKDAQLASVKEEYLSVLRAASAGGAAPPREEKRRAPAAPIAAAIKAFRPPGVAPPPDRQRQERLREQREAREARGAAEAAVALEAAAAEQAQALAAMRLDNDELRTQLRALEATCAELRARVGPAPQRADQQRPASPGPSSRATLVAVASPRLRQQQLGDPADCDLTVAVFQVGGQGCLARALSLSLAVSVPGRSACPSPQRHPLPTRLACL